MSDTSTSGMGKRRSAARHEQNADYAAKRAQLIKAAAEVFRRKGYAGATLGDIAKEFGTDRASLYYYFSSKDELFQACITDTVVLNLQRAEDILARNDSPIERLKSLIAMLIHSQVEHWPYMYVYMQEDMARVGNIEAQWAQEMVVNTKKLEKKFISVINDGIEAGQIRADIPKTLIANSLFGMTQWTHRWFVPGQSRYSPEDLIHAFTTIFLNGSLTEPQRQDQPDQ